MQEETRDALVSITAFAAVFGMVYIYLMTRHRERMAMLERGLTVTPFKAATGHALTLKYGLFLLGIGFGFVLGSIAYRNLGMEEEPAYISMISIFGGLGLIVSYLILQKQQADQQQ